MIATIRLTLRVIIFVFALLLYFAVAVIIVGLSGFSFKKARPVLTRLVSLTSKVGLLLFNVKVHKNATQFSSQENYLLVSNHLSYLDILIISSFLPTCFVTSVEMKHTPFLGQICLLGGCLFVERRNKRGLSSEVKELAHALQSGLNVVIFPEARSTNGEAVIPFKRPLFQAAIEADVKVLPVCLNYQKLGDEKITPKNRDKVFWYGDMGFLGHALTLFSHKGTEAHLSVLDPISIKEFPEKALLAQKTFEVVKAEYQEVIYSQDFQ